MYSVLVYPNITWAKDLEADSYIVAVGGMVRALNAVRDDLEFTMLLPGHVQSLDDVKNIRQVRYPLPTYPNQMRTHFDSEYFLSAIDWRQRSYDIVWSHLPEHTLQIKNVFYNVTNEQPIFVGYCHWFEVEENTEYRETMLDVNLAGVLAMKECGVNSQWLKDLVIGYAANRMSESRVRDLSEIVKPQYLGSAGSMQLPMRILPKVDGTKYILFNHRANAYTGWIRAIRILDALWEKRKDWRLVTTIAESDRPYAVKLGARSRGEYLSMISECDFGIGCFEKYSAWSVSVMDGLRVGVPYALPMGLCYPEMVGTNWPYLYTDDSTLLGMLSYMLDHGVPMSEKQKAREVALRFTWDKVVEPYSEMFDRAIAKIPSVGDRSERIREVDEHIRHRGVVTKEEIMKMLGWGRSFAWTPYRNWLRRQGVNVTSYRYSRMPLSLEQEAVDYGALKKFADQSALKRRSR